MPSFSTTNFHLVAALLVSGFLIARIDRSNPRQAKFFFNENAELKKTVDSYFDGSLQIPALRHFQEYTTMSQRVNAE